MPSRKASRTRKPKAKTTGKTAAKYHKSSARFGFAEWSLPTLNGFRAMIEQTIREAIENATLEYECDVWFAAQWGDTDGAGGLPPADPVMIYVALPLGPNEDSHPHWQFSLQALVRDVIALYETPDGSGKLRDADGIAVAKAIRDGLDACATMLDEAIVEK